MRIALLQLRSIVGRLEWNSRKIVAALQQAAQKKVDLLVCPELALIGYPSSDLLACQWILEEEAKALEMLRLETQKCAVSLLIGHTERTEGNWFYNSASLYENGKTLATIRKQQLPSYNIFSEARHFIPYTEKQDLVLFKNKKLCISICEDAWSEVEAYGPLYPRKYLHKPPYLLDERANAELHINLSASPFEWGKSKRRQLAFQKIAQNSAIPFLWVNRVGAQDEIIFDGESAIYNPELKAKASFCQEEMLVWDSEEQLPTTSLQNLNDWEKLELALVRGIQDFVQQSSPSKKLVIGLSGGIDSACVAALAVKSVGAENVLGLSLPSRHTTLDSKKLIAELAHNLKIELKEIPLQQSVSTICKEASIPETGIPYENIQSRMRGLMLMAYANKEKALMLSCGNKSELATGYGTLYGDIAGALAPIGDLFKSEVYGLCYFLNHKTPLIPEGILSRIPTAELSDNQKDTDSLPRYEVLDAFLYEMMDRQGNSFHKEKEWDNFLSPYNLKDLLTRVLGAEFKRYQAPPVLKVHNRSFGRSWQMPIAHRAPTS